MSYSQSRSSLENIDPQALRIVLYPDPILRQPAQPIEQITDQVREVALRMLELMHAAPGVGLAGPQVGLPWRIFVTNPTGEKGDDRVYINPVLSDPSRETGDHEEGCLSLPNITATIRRPLGLTIEATDLEGTRFRQTSNEFEARIWQHEYDHLEGVLILDWMNVLDRKANRRAIADLESRG